MGIKLVRITLRQCTIMIKHTAFKVDRTPVYLQWNAPFAFEVFYRILNNCLSSAKENISVKRTFKHLRLWIISYLCQKVARKNILYENVLKQPKNLKNFKYFETNKPNLQANLREIKKFKNIVKSLKSVMVDLKKHLNF